MADKIEAWMNRTGMCRKTWYNYLAKYYAAIGNEEVYEIQFDEEGGIDRTW